MTTIIAADIGIVPILIAIALLLTGASIGAFAMGLAYMTRKPAPMPTCACQETRPGGPDNG